MENSAAQVKQMGLVVHGQTCCQLAKRLERESCPPLSERGILLLGTNDILKGLPLNDFLRGMEKSIDLLLQKLDHITVLSFLLIPRLAAATNQTEHLKTLNSYNVIIRGLVTQNMASMKFIDIVPLFLGDGNEIKMELVKKDQLHLSDDATEIRFVILLLNFCDNWCFAIPTLMRMITPKKCDRSIILL